jgi:hypothetical protein
MTLGEWKKLVGGVADRMKQYTRPYVTPIRTGNEWGVGLLGTGSYIATGERKFLLTCEHVIRARSGIENQFWGSDTVYGLPDPFVDDMQLDVVFAPVPDDIWNAEQHQAKLIRLEEFAPKHQPVQHELLFFRGFATENAHYGFGIHEANATGYCSQEPPIDPIRPEWLEMLWKSDVMEFTPDTSDEMKSKMRHHDPHGFSGSLVWNTRYVEKTAARQEWKPEYAVVTGLLLRHFPDRKTLAALRVERLKEWIESKL